MFKAKGIYFDRNKAQVSRKEELALRERCLKASFRIIRIQSES